MGIEIGQTVGGYQVIALLGRGGMGKVYKVRNVISDRVEAMKVLLDDATAAPDLAERFLREIKVVAALEHPNIASLRTAFKVDDQLIMIMELVEGSSLDEKLRGGRLNALYALECTCQVLAALSYAHRLGVIHRDIKPANILITAGGVVKLTDFGIASKAGDPKLTAPGTALGSLYYMSPEQLKAEPLEMVFIRAPWIEETGPGVEVLAREGGRPVLVRDGRILVATFHPELTEDTTVHEYFLKLVSGHLSGVYSGFGRLESEVDGPAPALDGPARSTSSESGASPSAPRPRF